MKPEIKNYLSEIGKKGGSVGSEAKARASKANGAKGGRPHEVICYRQGGNWILSDREAEQLPYWVQTKQQVREFVSERAQDRGIKVKIKFA